jgi:hypothetical protein
MSRWVKVTPLYVDNETNRIEDWIDVEAVQRVYREGWRDKGDHRFRTILVFSSGDKMSVAEQVDHFIQDKAP